VQAVNVYPFEQPMLDSTWGSEWQRLDLRRRRRGRARRDRRVHARPRRRPHRRRRRHVLPDGSCDIPGSAPTRATTRCGRRMRA
jgi:hypothetical protein